MSNIVQCKYQGCPHTHCLHMYPHERSDKCDNIECKISVMNRIKINCTPVKEENNVDNTHSMFHAGQRIVCPSCHKPGPPVDRVLHDTNSTNSKARYRCIECGSQLSLYINKESMSIKSVLLKNKQGILSEGLTKMKSSNYLPYGTVSGSTKPSTHKTVFDDSRNDIPGNDLICYRWRCDYCMSKGIKWLQKGSKLLRCPSCDVNGFKFNVKTVKPEGEYTSIWGTGANIVKKGLVKKNLYCANCGHNIIYLVKRPDICPNCGWGF